MVDLESGVRVIQVGAGPRTFIPKDELWPFMPEFRDGILRFVLDQGASYDVIHGKFWMSGWVGQELATVLDVPLVHIFHAMGKTKARHQGGADGSPSCRIEVAASGYSACGSDYRSMSVRMAGAGRGLLCSPDSVTIIPSAVDAECSVRSIRPTVVRALAWIPAIWSSATSGGCSRERTSVMSSPPRPSRAKRCPIQLPSWWSAAKPRIQTPRPRRRSAGLGAAHELGIADTVRFYGKRHSRELATFYGAADVIVTTPWYEPFGLTPLEAMACGKPVIGSAVGGLTFTVSVGRLATWSRRTTRMRWPIG